MICNTCELQYGDLSQNTGTCPECLAILIANAVPEGEESDFCSECGEAMTEDEWGICGKCYREGVRMDEDENEEDDEDDGFGEPKCEVRGEFESCRACDPDEPEEGDWVTRDHVTFHEHGDDGILVVQDGTDWRNAIKKVMDAEQFWPNVWFLSDHGNAQLMDLEKSTDE